MKPLGNWEGSGWRWLEARRPACPDTHRYDLR